MRPIFVLSYPRSRTAWLATYLTGAGVFAFHEAWKHVKTAKQLRALMQSKAHGASPVVNVDCVNWFFLEELQDEFPDALYIQIDRRWEDVVTSARASFGEQDYDVLFKAYQRAKSRSTVQPDLTVTFESWSALDSLAVWQLITHGALIDPHWHRQMHECFVELSPAAVAEELRMGRDGELLHLARRMARA